MDNTIWVTFVTGLTAGGLSCFAVQGGLLSGVIAHRVDAEGVNTQGTAVYKTRSKKKPAAKMPLQQKEVVQSTLLFLAAKLVAYTLVGFLLGWLGSVLTISPLIKGALQIAIGIFLVGNGLRMANVHPIFRYFSFEPPHQVTRFIRKLSKSSDTTITPLYLGALTILIPCGVTQSVMAVAIGTGSPWMGAAIMFSFILGTSPTFLGVTYLATSLARGFQKYFYPVVTVIVLGMGLYTLNGGLNLVGSPFSANAIIQSLQSETAASTNQAYLATSNVVRINVQNSGYSPNNIIASAGQAIALHMVTQNTYSCARAFVIPSLNFMKVLPDTGDTVINLPAQAKGSRLDFTCSMGMYNGVIQFQ
jgi:sulfite exporter TauE/SafE